MTRHQTVPGLPVTAPQWQARYPSDGTYQPLDDAWANLATSRRGASVTVTTGSPAHTAGAWAELVASMPEQIDGFTLRLGIGNTSGADTSRLMDVGVGAAGSEVVVVENMMVGYNGAAADYYLPVRVPKGARLAVRARGAADSDGRTVEWDSANTSNMLGPIRRRPDLPRPTRLLTAGADTATSGGVVLTAPGSTHTKAAWTTVSSGFAVPLRGLLAFTSIAPGTTNTPASGYLLWDVAMGAAGAETLLAANTASTTGSTESIAGGRATAVWRHIPAGIRIAGRYQRASTSIDLCMTLIGVPYS